MLIDPQYDWIMAFAALLAAGGTSIFCVAAFRRRIFPVHPLAPLSLVAACAGVLVLVLGSAAANRQPDARAFQQGVNIAGACVLLAAAGLACHALWRFWHLHAHPLDDPQPGRPFAYAAVIVALAALCAEGAMAFLKTSAPGGSAPAAVVTGDVPGLEDVLNPRKLVAEIVLCGAVMAWCVMVCRRRVHPVHPLAPSSLMLACAGVLVMVVGAMAVAKYPASAALPQVVDYTVNGVLLAASALAVYAVWRFWHMHSRPLDGPWPGRRYAYAALTASLGILCYRTVMAHGGAALLAEIPEPYAVSRAGFLSVDEQTERVIWVLHGLFLLGAGVVIAISVMMCRRRVHPIHPLGPSALVMACAGIVIFIIGLDVISGFGQFHKARLVVGALGACSFLGSFVLSALAVRRFWNQHDHPIDGPWPGKPFAYAAATVSAFMLLAMAYYGVTLKKGLPLNPAKWEDARNLYMFPQAGCAYRLPLGWKKQDAPFMNPRPLLAATRVNPTLSLALVATPPGTAVQTVRELSQRTVDELLQSGAKVTSPRLEEDPRGEAQTAWLACRVLRGKGKFAYAVWLCVHDGYNYQLYLWGPVENLTIIRDSGDAIRDHFLWFREQK